RGRWGVFVHSMPRDLMRYRHHHRALVALLGLALAGAAAAQVRTPEPVYPSVRTLLETGSTVTGEPIAYPAGAARISVVEITLAPGQQTGWHTHPVPLIGYIIEGELTVDYGAKGTRVYRAGEALAEAMNFAHNGRAGGSRVKILAVFLGAEGVAGTVAAPSAR
ncbi:MAG: cupin domain-containing protein, partial [Bradyrhizobium sp.]